MKYSKISLLFLVFSLTSIYGFSQAIVKDTVLPKSVMQSIEGKKKIDGIIATVGDYLILDSDIDKNFLELSSQGISTKDISRCQMLGKLLEDRLYAHQAVQDSIVVTDAEIKSKLEEQLGYMVEQLGSMDKVVNYFKKSSEEDFRGDLFEIIKMNKLTSEMQKKIVDEVTITPEEVRNFFKKIPENELPTFGSEVEVAQIVVEPKVTAEDKQVIIDRLKEYKSEVLAGSSFATKAVLYSQDPGSSSNGGYYKMNKKTPFVKEFKDVAFGLAEGEISEPFETQFGYHIIMVDKIKGQEIELRHIVIAPKVTEDAIKEAKDKIIQIRNKIVGNELSFEQAARTESDEKETRANGGILINPKTQDTKFELTKMDPSLYSQISSMNQGEVSNPILDTDAQSQKKKYKILTVLNKIPEHKADYAKDYIKIKDLALKEKQINAIAKWSEEKIKETYININKDYKNCEFANNWQKK